MPLIVLHFATVAAGLVHTPNIAVSNITASSITASGDVIVKRLITSGSTANSGLVFPNPNDLTNLTSNRINLTSAQNMQFRAGGAFQFSSNTQLLAGRNFN